MSIGTALIKIHTVNACIMFVLTKHLYYKHFLRDLKMLFTLPPCCITLLIVFLKCLIIRYTTMYTKYVGLSIKQHLEHQLPVGTALFKIHVGDTCRVFKLSIICVMILIQILRLHAHADL